MSNRLSKADFFVIFMILLSLACLIGGFFLGANIGKGKAEKEFNRYVEDMSVQGLDTDSLNYSHTDFVSFYHQVYIPFKEFRNAYIDFEQQVQDPDQTLKELSKSVDMQKLTINVKKELESAHIPNTSPLLQQSRKEYILALQAYELGFKNLFSLDNEQAEPVHTLIQEWDDFLVGKNHWLKGQSLFYEALVLWESFFVTKENPKLVENASNYTLHEWAQLSFHHRNDLIAKVLADQKIVTTFNPEDVTVYLDALSKHSNLNKQQKVVEALQFLIASNSIRQGEFLEKIKEYDSVDFPMVPLFSN